MWWSVAQWTVEEGGARCELRGGSGPGRVVKTSAGRGRWPRRRREPASSGGVVARELGGGGCTQEGTLAWLRVKKEP